MLRKARIRFFGRKIVVLLVAAAALLAAAPAQALHTQWATGSPGGWDYTFERNNCASVYTGAGPYGSLTSPDARIALSPAPALAGEEASQTVDMWVGVYWSSDGRAWHFWKWSDKSEKSVFPGVRSSAELDPVEFRVPPGFYYKTIVYVEWKKWNFYTAQFRLLGSTHFVFDAGDYGVGNSNYLTVRAVGDGCYFG
jgi:hypothetical protein